jgi:hypothetical protein
MNYRKSLIASLMTLGIASFAYQTTAQDMDVDQADTMDFESFHKDKKAAIKVWDKKSSSTTKVYEQKPAASGNATSSTEPATAAGKSGAPVSSVAVPAATATTSAAAAQTPQGETGKRFEIRERYTLTRSTATPYSAFYVIEPLYKQSAQLCPRGWKKLAERSEPVEQDFYLYYLIECL